MKQNIGSSPEKQSKRVGAISERGFLLAKMILKNITGRWLFVCNEATFRKVLLINFGIITAY